MQVLSPPPKKGLYKNFSGDLQKRKKKGLHKNFSSDLHKKTFSKKFFKRSTKFLPFKKYCCPRAEDRPIFEDLRPRGRGQGLKNVSSRPRTSSRTPPLLNTGTPLNRYDLVDNPFMRPEDTEMVANICSFEHMEAATNEFQLFKAPGPDGLCPALLQKGCD